MKEREIDRDRDREINISKTIPVKFVMNEQHSGGVRSDAEMHHVYIGKASDWSVLLQLMMHSRGLTNQRLSLCKQ